MHEQSIRDLFSGIRSTVDQRVFLARRQVVVDKAFEKILEGEWFWERTINGLLGEYEIETRAEVKDFTGAPVLIRVLLVVDDHLIQREYSAFLYIGDKDGPSFSDARVDTLACKLFGAETFTSLPGHFGKFARTYLEASWPT